MPGFPIEGHILQILFSFYFLSIVMFVDLSPNTSLLFQLGSALGND